MTNTHPQGSPGAPPASYSPNPSAGSSLMPRRSSYASVVSGSASATPNQSQTARSGALSQLMNQAPQSTNQGPNTSNIHHSRSMSRNMNVDVQGGPAGGLGSSPWSKGGQMPSYSSQFGLLGNSPGTSGNWDANAEGFFVPSYLRNSKHMERLGEAHKAKLSAHREGPSTHSSNGGSLSTSSSSANLHKMAPSHRGMTYDIIEKEPLGDDDGLTPLPTRWNEADRFGGIDIQGGLDIRFVGSGKSHELIEAATVRADHPMPPQCGIYYYEVSIRSKGKEATIGVGFSSSNVSLNRLPGWEPESWAYHGDDGRSFCCSHTGRDYGPKFANGDVIGCGVNFRTGCAFFTKNGLALGTAFRDIKGKLYPSVGMKRPGEHVTTNFGQRPFVFDVDGLMAKERAIIEAEINATSVAALSPPLDETSLIQALVAQFLSHDGYIETARAFSEEVSAETRALRNGRESSTALEAKEDLGAINRQRIRLAILEGDIDKAFKHTHAFYPNVLEENEHIYFRLRCRKFIEMIRQCAELHLVAQGAATKQVGTMNGHSSNAYGDVFEHDMEVDDQVGNGETWETMETEEADANMKHIDLLQETVKYGQVLQSEFRDDGRKEVKKALEETFSLLAYEDPKSSVVAHLLEPSGRIPVAEELNSAILVSQGKSSSAALERLYQQTEVLIQDIGEDGGPGAFINVCNDFLR
ncbi:MAG: hypothetical protein M1833_005628 [Piccolia ochrophora]|nr:MAG: hypothetical protein M1833_005628 [Piccolia ochrophora]